MFGKEFSLFIGFFGIVYNTYFVEHRLWTVGEGDNKRTFYGIHYVTEHNLFLPWLLQSGRRPIPWLV